VTRQLLRIVIYLLIIEPFLVVGNYACNFVWQLILKNVDNASIYYVNFRLLDNQIEV